MARIISGNRTAEDIVRMHLQKLQEEAQKPKVPIVGAQPPLPPVAINQPPIPAATVNPLSLIFQNITCVGADHKPFEQYDKLSVISDVVRGNGTYNNSTVQKHEPFTPYQAISFFEQRTGLFLPSIALSCNLLVASYQNKNHAAFEALLQQYKDYGPGHGYHAQNTVINWGTKHIIHYPGDNDFPEHGGSNNINQSRSHKRFTFDSTGFSSTTLEDALKMPNFKTYIQNLTGLPDPSVLIDIAAYFGKTARVWVSSSNETRAAWFGCVSDNLNLYGNYYLNYNSAARGVRLGAP